MHALIQHGVVWQLFEADPMLPSELDIRDVSDVHGIEEGWVLKDDGSYAPPPPPETETAGIITYKADLYRRCTDAEAEAIEVALAGAPVRERRLFECAQYLDHAAPEFVALHEHLVGMFGQSRADALLAAS